MPHIYEPRYFLRRCCASASFMQPLILRQARSRFASHSRVMLIAVPSCNVRPHVASNTTFNAEMQLFFRRSSRHGLRASYADGAALSLFRMLSRQMPRAASSLREEAAQGAYARPFRGRGHSTDAFFDAPPSTMRAAITKCSASKDFLRHFTRYFFEA